MSRRRKQPLDFEQNERECKSYLIKLRNNVSKKVVAFGKQFVKVKKAHEKFKVVVTHLHDINERILCDHYAKFWFLVLLMTHDASQLIQNGKFYHVYLLNYISAVDEIHPDRKGDFSWTDGTCNLNCVSIQGFDFCGKELMASFDKEQVNFCLLHRKC
jgi:hypothetical protein